MRTYIVSFRLSRPGQQLALLKYGLKTVVADYAEIEPNLLLVHSLRSADSIANALMPGLSCDDELRVMEIGRDIASHNMPLAWREAVTTH